MTVNSRLAKPIAHKMGRSSKFARPHASSARHRTTAVGEELRGRSVSLHPPRISGNRRRPDHCCTSAAKVPVHEGRHLILHAVRPVWTRKRRARERIKCVGVERAPAPAAQRTSATNASVVEGSRTDPNFPNRRPQASARNARPHCRTVSCLETPRVPAARAPVPA